MPVKTGLKKVCPRCLREGDVYTDDTEYFSILWEGEPRGPDVRDADTRVSIEELLSPTFGCGYDL
jgi:hypothetical protein